MDLKPVESIPEMDITQEVTPAKIPSRMEKTQSQLVIVDDKMSETTESVFVEPIKLQPSTNKISRHSKMSR